MNKLIKFLKQKTTITGLAAVLTGVGLLISGNSVEGIQTVIGGIGLIFVRQAIEKSIPDSSPANADAVQK